MLNHPSPPSEEPFQRIDLRDLDAAMTEVRRLYGSEIRGEARGELDWHAKVAVLGPVVVMQETVLPPMVLDGVIESYLLTIPLEKTSQLTFGGEAVALVPGRTVSLVSPLRPTALRTSTGVRHVNLRIDPAIVAAELTALSGEPAPGPVTFAPELRLDGPTGAYVQQLCGFLIAQIEAGTFVRSPSLAHGLIESLVRALLQGQAHDRAHLLEKPPLSSRSTVRLVEEYVDAHAGEPLPMADLARVAGASMVSIDAAFLAHRGTSPRSFLRERRLAHAQRTLLTDPSASLARVAYAAGFARPELFEAAYLKAFRETPAATRKRALAGPAAPFEEAARITPAEALASLSHREREVCARVARGMLNKQVAAELGIAEATVRDHRARGTAKLGVGSAAELARLFARLERGE